MVRTLKGKKKMNYSNVSSNDQDSDDNIDLQTNTITIPAPMATTAPTTTVNHTGSIKSSLPLQIKSTILLFIEFIIIAAVGSKVFVVLHSNEQEEYEINVASGSEYVYQECRLGDIKKRIGEEIDHYAILFSIYILLRVTYLITATYLHLKHAELRNRKLLFVLCVVNWLIPATFLLYLCFIQLLCSLLGVLRTFP